MEESVQRATFLPLGDVLEKLVESHVRLAEAAQTLSERGQNERQRLMLGELVHWHHEGASAARRVLQEAGDDLLSTQVQYTPLLANQHHREPGAAADADAVLSESTTSFIELQNRVRRLAESTPVERLQELMGNLAEHYALSARALTSTRNEAETM